MTTSMVAPYGSWKSPITLDMVADETIELGRIALDGDDVYWIETRPFEDGRSVLVKRGSDGALQDLTPPEFSVGTMVHEYGTRSFIVAEGVIYFSNYLDHRVYRQRVGEEPKAITPKGELRYGSKVFDGKRGRVICVCEDHGSPDAEQPVNDIVAIDIQGRREPEVLVTSNDFYSSPALSPDGNHLAWLTWDHPSMPWDGTELWVAPVAEDGTLGESTLVAGGVDEAVIQPEWSPEGELYFVSDRSGWANLYRWRNGEVEPVLEMDAEFAKANWWVGMCSYGFDTPSSLICSYVSRGVWSLARLYLRELSLEPIAIPYWEMSHGDLQVVPGRVVFAAGSPGQPISLLQLDLEDGELAVVQVESDVEPASGYLSLPEAIEFPTSNNETAHAFFYPPANQDYSAPDDERPPLLVTCHGGPHSAATAELNLAVQYWTSRGIGVLDVNYGGSTGYGRDFRERLIGEWGVVDVNDCVNAALYLVERGDVDGNRIAISGGSAGGFTALAALTFRNVFKAGASYFGVSDLESLLTDIHKFDTHSLVGLVGPYPLYRKRYIERSPINYPDHATCPTIFFQGLEDTIVPAIQSEEMFKALRRNGVPTAYLAFEGEHHGFRQAETIKRALAAEFYFYSRIFGFVPADDLEPIPIENLDQVG